MPRLEIIDNNNLKTSVYDNKILLIIESKYPYSHSIKANYYNKIEIRIDLGFLPQNNIKCLLK